MALWKFFLVVVVGQVAILSTVSTVSAGNAWGYNLITLYEGLILGVKPHN